MNNILTMPIDFNDFERVPEATRQISGSAINISCSGHVSLNNHLMTEMKQRGVSMKLDFLISKKDKELLLLVPTETPGYAFPKNGSKKDSAFTQSLVDAGIPLPARYTVGWNESASAWVGILSTPRSNSPLSASIKAGQAPRGKRK